MNITHVISGIDPSHGGPTSALIGLAAAQVKVGMQVNAVACWQGAAPPSTVEALRNKGSTVSLIGPTRGKLRRHASMASILEAAVASADVVHIHGLWEEVQHQAAVIARRHRKPHIFRTCGLLAPWSLAQSKWKKKACLAWRVRRNLDAATAIHFTAAMERDLAAPLQLVAPPIVVPNGVDLEEFLELPPRGFLRSRFPEFASRPVILFVGRIHQVKGLDLLIPALAAVRQPDAALVIAGPGSSKDRDILLQLAGSLGLADRVTFCGPLYGRDRIAAYVDADLFVLPSRHENFGIVVAESLAAGTPVVVSDQVNIHSEIAAAGVGGVTSLRIEDLAATLERWLTDDHLRHQAAQKARPFAMSEFNWDSIAERWRQIYAGLVCGPSGTQIHCR